MKRKLLSLVLAIAMAVSLFTTCASAVGEEERALQRWSECGVLSDEAQNPDEEMTREQLAALLVRLLKLPESSGSTDVERCIAAGLFDSEDDTDGALPQTQAMVILGRALGLEAASTSDSEDGTGGMLTAMIQAGIVSEDTVGAEGGMSLASVATLLDRAIGNYVSEDGATVSAENASGITLVVAKNVTVTGNVDTLVVASSESSVKLDGATVSKVSVTGESSTVVLNNAEVRTVVASGAKTAVETTGTTKVETVAVTGTGASVKTADDTTVGKLEVSAESASVETAGKTKVEAVAVTGAGTTLKTADETTLGKLEVSAENAAVETTGKTKVETVAVTGTGTSVKTADETTLGKLEVSAENAAVETTGKTKVETVAVTGTGASVKTADETTLGKLEVSAESASVETTGATKVETIAVTGANAAVKTADNTTVGKLEVSAENAAVETQGSTQIASVTVSEKAAGTTVTTGSGTTISKVENRAEGTTVTGSGTVETVESSKDVAVETQGTKVDNAGDAQITVTGGEGQTSTIDMGASGTTTPAAPAEHTHSYTSATTTAATCTGEGVVTYTCTCGASYTEAIPATGHRARTLEAVPATCTTAGSAAGEECSVCGETLSGLGSVPALGHRARTVEAVPATCTEAGVAAGEVCTVCGETLSGFETLPAKGHSLGGYVYTNISTHTRSCSECDYTESGTHSFAGEDGILCLGCGVYFVKTDAKLKEAVAAENTGDAGKTIVLTGDVTGMQQGLSVAQNVAFDLNTHTLGTAAGVSVMKITHGKVSIRNGTVSVAPIVNGNSSQGSGCITIDIYTASKKSVTLDLEKVTVIGCENQKSGVTSDTVDGLVADGMCGSNTTAGTALSISGSGSAAGTTVNISDSTITGGYGSATNGTQVERISGDGIGGANFAEGGIGIDTRGAKTVVNITNSTVTGGNSDRYNAGNAIEGRGGELNISGSTVTGGSCLEASPAYGIGGEALYLNGMFDNVNVTVTESTVTGGDGGESWDGNGIEIGCSPVEVTVVDSTVSSGDGARANKNAYNTAIRNSGWDKVTVKLEGDNTLASSSTQAGVIQGDFGIELDGELTIEKGTMKSNSFDKVGENASIKVEEGAGISTTTVTAEGKTLTRGEDGAYRFTENQ